MSPFIENPAGLTPETLELMDKAMKGAWHDLQMKNNESALDKKQTSNAAAAVVKSGHKIAKR